MKSFRPEELEKDLAKYSNPFEEADSILGYGT